MLKLRIKKSLAGFIAGGLFLSLAAAVLGTSAGALQFNSATRASLELDVSSARPGDTVTAGLRMQMEEGWHTYWVNPGTGLPTEIEWKLPEGVTAGEIQWPTPEKYLDAVSGGYDRIGEHEFHVIHQALVAADFELHFDLLILKDD